MVNLNLSISNKNYRPHLKAGLMTSRCKFACTYPYTSKRIIDPPSRRRRSSVEHALVPYTASEHRQIWLDKWNSLRSGVGLLKTREEVLFAPHWLSSCC